MRGAGVGLTRTKENDMTDRKDALTKLLDEIELGNVAPFAPLVERIVSKFSQKEINLVQKANQGSLDAAKALHEAVLPRWRFIITINGVSIYNRAKPRTKGYFKEGQCATNPARAWLIAILKALIAGENTNANDKGE
jgi:hypothetical protein